MITRELFYGFSSSGIAFFYIIGFSVIAFFLFGIYRHIRKYAKGKELVTKVDLLQNIKKAAIDIFSHKTIKRRDRYAGLAHSLVFYGFLIAFIGTSIITLEYDITKPLFGITFWHGYFYLIFSLILDLGGLAMFVGIIMLMIRRSSFGLEKLGYIRKYRGENSPRPIARIWKRGDWFFLILLLLIVISGFVQEGIRLAIDNPEWKHWSPVGVVVANILSSIIDVESAGATIRSVNWWFHGLIALSFIALVPWYKAKHIITAIGSLMFRDPMALKRLPRIPVVDVTDSEHEEIVGVSKIEEFDWKNLLHLDACTKCGRCHEACPARDSGYALSPRDFILDLRTYNETAAAGDGVNLIGDIISPETLWACRSCGACQEICPVGIEHPTMIIQMRRHLVDQGKMDPLLQSVLSNLSDKGNSFGESPKSRADWVKTLEFPVKDIRKEPSTYMWFVGDYAAFDPRNQIVSRTVARLFKVAGVDFGLLHEGEKNAGNDIRRVGEEGLFETLVEENLEAFNKAQTFQSIITTDPHSYNTIKNEYPEYGETPDIEHYTTVIANLLESGKLKVRKPLNKRVTFHDPCHLGRLNGGYEPPRKILELIGCELVEMPRNRDNSFCCGAGGGRIWIPDDPGTAKPSESRMEEAAKLGAIDYFITCCPKDLTMFEDARKTSGHEDDFLVKDIAELVAEAIELDKLSLKDVPQLMEDMANVIVDKVIKSVNENVDQIIQTRLEIFKQSYDASLTKPLIRGESALELAAAVEQHVATPENEMTVPQEAMTSEIIASDKRPVETHAPKEPATEVITQSALPKALGSVLDVTWELNKLSPISFADLDVEPKNKIRIFVAVKHVGKILSAFSIQENHSDVAGEFIDYEFNEFDDNALEAALRLKEKHDTINGEGSAEVIAVTVGDESAEDTLRKALAKGADRAIRVWNDSLIGADPFVLAQILAGVAEREDVDFIFTGVQSADKANGATGAIVAGILNRDCAAVVVDLEWDGGSSILVSRELEGGVIEKLQMPTSTVFTVQIGSFEPRFASMRMIKQAKKKEIKVIEFNDSMQSQSTPGCRIERLYQPAVDRAEMLEGSVTDIANKIKEIIEGAK